MLTAFGVSIALLISQFGSHIQNRINLDGQGIDIVVGAKGSPLQLILSSVYHIDIPTGNISYDQAKKMMKNPQIEESIPLALGDNWRGFRIVGTTINYIKHYDISLSKGRYWDKNFEVVVGSSVNLNINDPPLQIAWVASTAIALTWSEKTILVGKECNIFKPMKFNKN